MRNLIKFNGNHYIVSSVLTSDHGYETMVFASRADVQIIDGNDLYCEQYESEAEMVSHHGEIVSNPKDYIF